MSGFTRSATLAALVCTTSGLSLIPAAHADQTLLSEDFSTNPITAGRAVLDDGGDLGQFTYSAGDGTLTAAYDTLQPTTKLIWPFPAGQTLTQADSFSFSTRFKVLSQGFFADPNGFAQIAFGLVNSVTTGTDRTGSFANFESDDSFDTVSVDYFPNVSPFFPSPSLQGNIFGSDDGNPNTDAFANYWFPGSAESALDATAFGESDLARDVFLTSTLSYDAATGRVTVTLADASGNLLNINGLGQGGPGGLDGDAATIQFDLPAGAAFEVDAFGLLLWNDGFAFGQPSVLADVVFDSFSVTVPVPEPATAAAMGLLAAAVALRRRRSA